MPRPKHFDGSLPGDERLASVSREARLTYVYALVQADDIGALGHSMRAIAGKLYPFDADVTDDILRSWVEELARADLMVWAATNNGPLLIVMREGDYCSPLYQVRPKRRPIPTAVRRAVLERDGHRCQACSRTKRLSLDHIIPYSAGGPDTIDNLRVLCVPCNSRRGNRSL